MSSAYLETISQDGSVPRTRVATPAAASSVYTDMLNADLISSKNRAAVDAMFNGEPPWNQEILDEMGRGDDCNVNWQQAFALLEQALSTYYDLINSPQTLVKVEVNYGPKEERALIGKNIAEAFTTLMRSWPEFEFWFQNLCLQFIKHGVGVAFFEGDIDFRFRTCGMADFKLPRNTPATEGSIEVASCCVPMTVSQLYKQIEDSEVATDEGWDVDQARKIIIEQANLFSQGSQARWENWELLANEIKENDLYYSSGRAAQVWIVHQWVREFDQSITHQMFPRDGAYDKFLYRQVGRFKKVANAFTIFTYGIGAGTYHTVRGLGYRIQAIIQALNMLQCKMADGAMDSMGTLIQPVDQSNSDVERLAVGHFGGLNVLPAGVKMVEKNIPDFSRSANPAFQLLSGQLRNNTVSFQGIPMMREAMGGSVQPTPVFQQRIEAEISSSLSASAMDSFYKPFDRLMAEVFRRATNPLYLKEDPGYTDYISPFKKDLLERGVPLDSLSSIKSIKVVRAIGAGSAAGRLLALNDVMQFATAMDEEGRYNLIRDFLVEKLGHDNVDRYMPPFETSKQRIPQDAVNAEFENFMIQSGMAPQFVRPNDNHPVHAGMHIALLQTAMENFKPVQGDSNIQALHSIYTMFQNTLPHLQQHIQLLSQDRTRIEQTKLYIQQFQQLNAAFERITSELQGAIEKLQAQEDEAARQQQEAFMQEYQALQEQAAQAQQGGDPKVQAKVQAMLIESATKMQIAKMEAEQKAKARQIEMMQKIAFADAKNQASIIEKAQFNVPKTDK